MKLRKRQVRRFINQQRFQQTHLHPASDDSLLDMAVSAVLTADFQPIPDPTPTSTDPIVDTTSPFEDSSGGFGGGGAGGDF